MDTRETEASEKDCSAGMDSPPSSSPDGAAGARAPPMGDDGWRKPGGRRPRTRAAALVSDRIRDGRRAGCLARGRRTRVGRTTRPPRRPLHQTRAVGDPTLSTGPVPPPVPAASAPARDHTLFHARPRLRATPPLGRRGQRRLPPARLPPRPQPPAPHRGGRPRRARGPGAGAAAAPGHGRLLRQCGTRPKCRKTTGVYLA